MKEKSEQFCRYAFCLIRLWKENTLYQQKEWKEAINIIRNEFDLPAGPTDSWATDSSGACILLGLAKEVNSDRFLIKRMPTLQDYQNWKKAFVAAKWGVKAAQAFDSLDKAYEDAVRRSNESRADSNRRKSLRKEIQEKQQENQELTRSMRKRRAARG
jgi:hypothetical protein